MNGNVNILPWHRKSWLQLSAYILYRRFPQALLITGINGVGKTKLAIQFAQSLLCLNQDSHGFFCGQCSSCTLFKAGNHPDFMSVHPDEPGKNISINQIRELNARLMLKPQFETYRTVVIYPAEQITDAAANAFLKTLEEPTERTLIILVTEKPFMLPTTIVSRCQKLHIATPQTQLTLDWLQPQLLGSNNASTLLCLANGAPLLAIDYAKNNIIELRQECFNSWTSVVTQQSSPVMIAEQWQNLSGTQILTWMITWVIDIIKCSSDGETTTLFNSDLENFLKRLANRLDLKSLFQFYDLLLISKKRQLTQVNKLLMFEEILIRWHQISHVR